METNKIIIDTSKEATMKEYSKIKGIPYSTVRIYFRRNKYKYRIVKELNNLILIQLED